MEVNLKYGYVFKKTLAAYTNKKKIIIHKGGTGSGKTYDLMIFLIFVIAMKEKNRVITIVSESKPHLDIGVIRILKQLMIQTGTFSTDEFNISSGRYTFKTGSIIEFFSADRIDKALGARRYLLYGNEINSLKFEVWDELARRSEYVIGDFNPTSQFWLEKFIEYYGEVEVIVSNFTNNPFLTDVERARIARRVQMDPNFKRIHVDCEYGSYEGLVFNGFSIIDSIPEDVSRNYGLDWGYTNDPTALVEIGMKGESIYMNEKIYQTGLTNSDIMKLLIERGVVKYHDEIVADSAEPKSIEDLRRAGYIIIPCLKGEDSIRKGIDFMKSRKLFVTKNSLNLIKELRNYSWIMDKSGNATNKPSDTFNHAIDAARYAIMSKILVNRSRMVKVGRI
jgi:phage terminase large subunit